jgi:hypothetical protein
MSMKMERSRSGRDPPFYTTSHAAHQAGEGAILDSLYGKETTDATKNKDMYVRPGDRTFTAEK